MHRGLFADELHEPDRHGVIDTQIPERVDLGPGFVGHARDPAFLASQRHLFAVIGAHHRALERAEILLLEHGLAHLFAERPDQLGPDLLQLHLREDRRVVCGQDLREPARGDAGEIQHLLQVIVAAGCADERGPAAVFFKDGGKVGPGAGVAEGILGKDDADRRGADQGIVIIGAHKLPGRAIHEADIHIG